MTAVAFVVRRRAVWLARWALVAAMVLGAAGLAAGHVAFRALGVTPAADAYGSIVLALLGFVGLVVGLNLAMLALAVVWAWRAPHDLRGHAVAFNAALVGGFTALAAVVVFVTVYATPRLG
jgi:hypothetical protein